MSMRFSKKAKKKTDETEPNKGQPNNASTKRFGFDANKKAFPQQGGNSFLKQQHLAAPRKTQGG